MSRLGKRLRRHAREQPDARAVFADRWWTYGELVAAAEPIAAGLAAGEVVAIVLARGIEVAIAVCAAALADAVPAMIDPGDAELAARTIDRLRPAIVVDAAHPTGVRRADPIARPGVALVISTSGSTADAKLVAWTNTRIAHDWTSMPPTPLQRAAPAGICVPLCTALGLQDLMRSLFHGLAAALLAVPFRVGLEQAVALGVNRLKLTPTHVDVLLATDVALPALRVVLVASAPIAPERLRLLAARLPAARIGRTYGLTESGAATVVWLDKTPGRAHTVGRAIGYRRITVRDAEGSVLPPRTWGEVVIDLPAWGVKDGYLDAPPELARRFTNATLWTGDRGKLDRRGFLVLGARQADLLKVGGRSVSARRIEESLRSAGELAVVGVPDRTLGQVPCAIYVPGVELAPLHAAARADEALRWLLPRHALPRATNGKLRRGVLGREAARWTSAFPQVVAPDHRAFPAFAVDPRVAIVDGGTAPWFGDPTPRGRAIALVTRHPVRVLATAYLEASATARYIIGPVAVPQPDGDVAPELLDVFAGELIRLVGLLPGESAVPLHVASDRAPFAAFTPAGVWRLR